MVTVRCPHCDIELKVKDELAGKNVKCPRCGKVLPVPQPTATVASQVKAAPAAEGRTLPPIPRGPAGQDSLADAGGQTAHRGGRKGNATHAPPAEGSPTAPFDFLAPAEKPDEIGRLGPYQVLQVLGAGGMGVVFRARDPHLERLVALKAMLPSAAGAPSARERFFREAKAAAALKHPHIVTIFQVGEDRGAPFLAMERLEGESLEDRLCREDRLPVAEVLRIGREVARGLAAAHQRGLIHRDIKPANIWLEGEPGAALQEGRRTGGHVKILDFGLARALGEQTQLTQSGMIVGTPAYMAPEQASGKGVDHRCDLFSLGCVLYRLATGEMPFKGEDTITILTALALETPPPPVALNPQVPAALSDLVMRLLAKKPEERPPSAQAVVEALQEIEGQMVERPAWSRSRSPGRSGRKRLPLPWLAGGVIGLAGVVVLLVLLLPHGGEPEKFGPEQPKDQQRTGQDGGGVGEPEKPEPEQPKGPPPEYTNTLVMKFRLIPAGKFTMGSSQQEIDHWTDRSKDQANFLSAEGPEHEVEITQPFYMGVHEVTVGQFRQFVTQKNYKVGDERWEKPGFKQGEDHPVVFVTWDNAVDFCAWLSEKEGKDYRLPTEAQWEYSCRGPLTPPSLPGGGEGGVRGTRYCFGNAETELVKYAWYKENSGGKTHPVGKLKPNAWDLYDMHGNAWEWCEDNYDPNYYKNSPAKDPPGPGGGERVIRGGSWDDAPLHCRSAVRNHCDPSPRHHSFGFRVLLALPPGGVRP